MAFNADTESVVFYKLGDELIRCLHSFSMELPDLLQDASIQARGKLIIQELPVPALQALPA